AASIHISGTGSSVVDTIFVCRAPGTCPIGKASPKPAAVAALVQQDCGLLRAGGVEPTAGDVRCILFGQLIRLAIMQLRPTWRVALSVEERLEKVATWVAEFGGPSAVERDLAGNNGLPGRRSKSQKGGRDAAIPV